MAVLPDLILVMPDRLLNDRDIVLAGVKKDGRLLARVSPELRDDLEIVLAAVRESTVAFNFASPRLKFHPDVVIAQIAHAREVLVILGFLTPELWANPAVRDAALKANPRVAQYAYELES